MSNDKYRPSHPDGFPDTSKDALVSDRLFDAHEVAAMLAVRVSWVREHTRLGEIPHIRLGRYVCYRHEAVAEWIEAQEQAMQRSPKRPPVAVNH